MVYMKLYATQLEQIHDTLTRACNLAGGLDVGVCVYHNFTNYHVLPGDTAFAVMERYHPNEPKIDAPRNQSGVGIKSTTCLVKQFEQDGYLEMKGWMQDNKIPFDELALAQNKVLRTGPGRTTVLRVGDWVIAFKRSRVNINTVVMCEEAYATFKNHLLAEDKTNTGNTKVCHVCLRVDGSPPAKWQKVGNGLACSPKCASALIEEQHPEDELTD